MTDETDPKKERRGKALADAYKYILSAEWSTRDLKGQEQMITPEYCTQNGGDCPSCSLVNYGRDCANNPLYGRWFTLGELAKRIAGGNLAQMAKMLNDTKTVKLDELQPDPAAWVARVAVTDLVAIHPGIVARRAGQLLGETIRA